jgi:hypothetical protein
MGMTDQRKRKQREDWMNTGPSESAQFVGAGGRGLVRAEGVAGWIWWTWVLDDKFSHGIFHSRTKIYLLAKVDDFCIIWIWNGGFRAGGCGSLLFFSLVWAVGVRCRWFSGVIFCLCCSLFLALGVYLELGNYKVVTLTSLSNGQLELLCLGKLLPCLS